MRAVFFVSSLLFLSSGLLSVAAELFQFSMPLSVIFPVLAAMPSLINMDLQFLLAALHFSLRQQIMSRDIEDE